MSKFNSRTIRLDASETGSTWVWGMGGGGVSRGTAVVTTDKESRVVYNLGILAALRRMDTQEEPAAYRISRSMPLHCFLSSSYLAGKVKIAN